MSTDHEMSERPWQLPDGRLVLIVEVGVIQFATWFPVPG